MKYMKYNEVLSYVHRAAYTCEMQKLTLEVMVKVPSPESLLLRYYLQLIDQENQNV